MAGDPAVVQQLDVMALQVFGKAGGGALLAARALAPAGRALGFVDDASEEAAERAELLFGVLFAALVAAIVLALGRSAGVALEHRSV
jgi:hypothetical protein